MKKKALVLCGLLVMGSMVFAQISVGVMGQLGWSASVARDPTFTALKEFKKARLNYGGGGYVGWTFFKGLGIQAEAAYVMNKGLFYEDAYKDKISVSVSTVDVPILVTYTFMRSSPFNIKLLLGPRLSFTMGDVVASLKISNEFGAGNRPPDNSFLIGIVGGADFSYSFTPASAVVLGLRYGYDFTQVINDFFNLAEIYVKLGFEYRFGK